MISTLCNIYIIYIYNVLLIKLFLQKISSSKLIYFSVLEFVVRNSPYLLHVLLYCPVTREESSRRYVMNCHLTP